MSETPWTGRYIHLRRWAGTWPYDKVPYFFSDQHDQGMEYSGYAPAWDQIVYRGDKEKREVIVFWLDHDRVVAGMNVNVWDVNDQIAAVVASKRTVDPAALADPMVELATVACSPD